MSPVTLSCDYVIKAMAPCSYTFSPQLTKQMGGVVKGLDKVMQTMDLEKVCPFHNSHKHVYIITYTVYTWVILHLGI